VLRCLQVAMAPRLDPLLEGVALLLTRLLSLLDVGRMKLGLRGLDISINPEGTRCERDAMMRLAACAHRKERKTTRMTRLTCEVNFAVPAHVLGCPPCCYEAAGGGLAS